MKGQREMKLAITGNDTLAKATRQCCETFFELVDAPQAEVIWICHDTPIREDGSHDGPQILSMVQDDLLKVMGSKCVVVSSQVPVGTTAKLESYLPCHRWVHIPENIRVDHAVSDFTRQERIVVGRRTTKDDDLLFSLVRMFTEHVIWTDPETAEMVKHALNCWLGMNIAYINEIARVCQRVGGNPEIITESLLRDRRVGSFAPLKAGPPFGGGHLARDIMTVDKISKDLGISIPIISNILKSNEV
jgi:UDPglucose 6-dehydrogenase